MLRKTVEAMRNANRRRTIDVYFVGFPKTGNTWLRFMLGCYLQDSLELKAAPLFDEFDGLGRAKSNPGVPRMTFTHAPPTWSDQTPADLDRRTVVEPFVGRKVVLLVRHPHDVLVSLWHQMKT